MILPPGTILQLMYLKERLRGLTPGRFVEIGVGQGFLSKLLLDQGWTGVGFDLNPESIVNAKDLNQHHIAQERYRLVAADWMNLEAADPVDLIISSMVLEHLDEPDEVAYLKKCRGSITDSGLVVLLVPASPAHWGMEDEIAGHFRRYTKQRLVQKAEQAVLKTAHIAGLTYPISNILYPLSEFLVRRAEAEKMKLSKLERTKQSGNRSVRFKTSFPAVSRLLLNEVVMYPFHLIQKAAAENEKSMVLYAEFTRQGS